VRYVVGLPMGGGRLRDALLPGALVEEG